MGSGFLNTPPANLKAAAWRLVIHRDIEPQQRSGDPRRCTHKLLDFGIAKILGSGRRGGNEPGAGDAA